MTASSSSTSFSHSLEAACNRLRRIEAAQVGSAQGIVQRHLRTEAAVKIAARGGPALGCDQQRRHAHGNIDAVKPGVIVDFDDELKDGRAGGDARSLLQLSTLVDAGGGDARRVARGGAQLGAGAACGYAQNIL